jgi:hypothetical protein
VFSVFYNPYGPNGNRLPSRNGKHSHEDVFGPIWGLIDLRNLRVPGNLPERVPKLIDGGFVKAALSKEPSL